MVLGCEAFGKYSSWEGRVLINGISALIKVLRNLPVIFHHVKLARRLLSMNKWAHTRPQICHGLDFELPSLQSCEKQMCTVYKLSSLWYSILPAQRDLDKCPS